MQLRLDSASISSDKATSLQHNVYHAPIHRLAGLTSRPRPPARGDSPYSLRSAARLALALAGQMGLKRVVFVGHADGALVALLATALASGAEDPPVSGVCSRSSGPAADPVSPHFQPCHHLPGLLFFCSHSHVLCVCKLSIWL